jgi:hypothetical protein
MMLSRLLLCMLLVVPTAVVAGTWRPVGGIGADISGADPAYARRTVERVPDGRRLTAHLAFFASPAYRLEVIDLGDGDSAAFASIDEAFRARGCIAGVNGGFFHADWQPLGLMIAGGRRTNRFETAKLLSGVVYSDAAGTHLVRRAGFRDHAGIEALLQTGPYLVDRGRAVRGLSAANGRPRTFIATDWRGHWVLGATPDRVTLAELAECLASPGALTPWRIDRAINLDGGTSSGFFFDRGPDAPRVLLRPGKRVRNLLGIIRR